MLAEKLSKKEQLDEKLLLTKLVLGDHNAFNTIYATYVKQLTHYASKFTADIYIIEDCIHDIFVWLWQNKKNLEITYTLKGYLLKCVRSSILRKVQKQKKTVLLEDTDDENVFSFCISSEEKFVHSESDFILREKMSSVLGLLTSKQKEVIYLRFYQNLSFDEIAISMDLTTKACYKLMGRAISELRKSSLHELQT